MIPRRASRGKTYRHEANSMRGLFAIWTCVLCEIPHSMSDRAPVWLRYNPCNHGSRMVHMPAGFATRLRLR